MKEITETTFSKILKNILAYQDCPKLSSDEAEVFSILNEQIDTLLSRLALNKSNLTESNQHILHDAILTEIHKILLSENQNQITATVITQAFQKLTEKHVKASIPVDNVYFSDDIAVLPGDGEVMLIGDPRANWTSEPQNTSEEGFRPLYLHRHELDNPETKIKIENFLKLQSQYKNKIIPARVKHVTHLILEANNHYNPLVDKYDAVGLIEYLSGSLYDQNKAEERISKLSSVKKFLEEFFNALYEARHTGMTTERILESAQKLSKQKTHTITSASKKTIFSAIHTLSQKPYSQTLISYFANRPDFVIVVYPDDTVLPNLFKQSTSGAANQGWNMISIAGTHRYNILSAIPQVTPQTFIIHKQDKVKSSILYGGYAHYVYKFDPIQKEYNFIENYDHPMAEHGLQKPESLLIEELSDLANVFLGGKGFRGSEIPAIIKVPKNIGWLSQYERAQFKKQLDALNQSCLSLKKISDKLIQGKPLNEVEEKSWNVLKNKLIEYEKNMIFYRRHILSEVNLSDFPSIKKGDKIATSKESSWAGATLEVVKIKTLPGNKAILHLIAPPLEKDHQLHHWVLDDLLFQIHKALHLDPAYQDKTYWLPIETMGRLRGILDNYPLASDLLSEVIPFFEIIDKKIKSAIDQQFFENIGTAAAPVLMEDTALSVCPIRSRNELPKYSHPAINRLSFFNEASEIYLQANNPGDLQFEQSPLLLSDGNMPESSHNNASLYLGVALIPGVLLSLFALYLIYRAFRPMFTGSENENKEVPKNDSIIKMLR